MRTCTSCGFNNADEVKFCQQCGNRQSGVSSSQEHQTIDLSGVGDKAKGLLQMTKSKDFPIYAAVALLVTWLIRQIFSGLDYDDSTYSTHQALGIFLESLLGDYGSPAYFIPLEFLVFLLTLYPFALAIYFLIARRNNWMIAGLYPVLTVFVYGALVLFAWIGYDFDLYYLWYFLGLSTLFETFWTFIAFFIDKFLILLVVAIAYTDFAARGPKFKLTK